MKLIPKNKFRLYKNDKIKHKFKLIYIYIYIYINIFRKGSHTMLSSLPLVHSHIYIIFIENIASSPVSARQFTEEKSL